MLKREINCLRILDHPNIVKLFDLYEDQKYLNLVMEYCNGGELLERILKKGVYDEQIAASQLRQIVLACNYLHQNGIVHRDLKPENFLFENKEENAQLKLIDFGLSTKFTNRIG
jgi:calcium-dependent protein kinase